MSGSPKQVNAAAMNGSVERDLTCLMRGVVDRGDCEDTGFGGSGFGGDMSGLRWLQRMKTVVMASAGMESND